MKKTITLVAIMITLGALVVAAAPQTTDSAVINLSGVIHPRVTITADVEDVTLDLYADAANVEIATVTEWSNIRAGYDVTLSSTNSGKLLNSVAAGEVLPYTVSYAGVSHDISLGAVNVTNSVDKAVGMGLAKPLGISYTADMDLGDGTYNDSLTFTITAK
jgi:hypothetical protein